MAGRPSIFRQEAAPDTGRPSIFRREVDALSDILLWDDAPGNIDDMPGNLETPGHS